MPEQTHVNLVIKFHSIIDWDCGLNKIRNLNRHTYPTQNCIFLHADNLFVYPVAVAYMFLLIDINWFRTANKPYSLPVSYFFAVA